jgi:hypothetical protein
MAIVKRDAAGLVVVLLAGIAVSIVLHIHFIRNWDRYLESWPSNPVTHGRASPPSPLVGGTSLSMKVGALAIFLTGLFSPLLARRAPWLAAISFAGGVGIAHAFLTVVPPNGMTNLWPIAVVLVALPTAISGFLGASVTAYLLSRHR